MSLFDINFIKGVFIWRNESVNFDSVIVFEVKYVLLYDRLVCFSAGDLLHKHAVENIVSQPLEVGKVAGWDTNVEYF